MKAIKKVLCLVVFAIMFISAASAIAEHSKAETVERMEMPELQSADDGNASAIEAHQFSELPGEATPSTRTPMVQIEPTDQYTSAQSPPDGTYTLEIQNGKITKIKYIPAASLETGLGAIVIYDQNEQGYTPQSISKETTRRILEAIAAALSVIAMVL